MSSNLNSNLNDYNHASKYVAKYTLPTIIIIIISLIIICIIYNYLMLYLCKTQLANYSSQRYQPYNQPYNRPYNQPYNQSYNQESNENFGTINENLNNHTNLQSFSKITNYEESNVLAPESKSIKFIIYYMHGCGYCNDIMVDKQANGMTKFEELKKIFSTNPQIKFLDFMYGRDKEANQYNSFPVIKIYKINGEIEYNGPRDVSSMANFIIQSYNN